MLNHISWQTYSVSIVTLLVLYYLYVGFTFYRAELRSFYYRHSGNLPAQASEYSLIPVPAYEIMGAAKPDTDWNPSDEALEFGPADPDELMTDHTGSETTMPATDSRLIGQFSEMISEVRTLIRVINESAESRENFDMLFKLIIQKYTDLVGTPYQGQVTEYLAEEGASQFPFDISTEELDNYWKN